MTEIHDTLGERHLTHGSYKDTAETSQSIKSFMCTTKNWRDLTDAQREALDLIATKIARILNGDPTQEEHWHDISGYATLVYDEVRHRKVDDKQADILEEYLEQGIKEAANVVAERGAEQARRILK